MVLMSFKQFETVMIKSEIHRNFNPPPKKNTVLIDI